MTYEEILKAKAAQATVRITEPPFIGHEGKITKQMVLFGEDWVQIEGPKHTRSATISGVMLA